MRGLVVLGVLALAGIIIGAVFLCPTQPPSPVLEEKSKEEVAPPPCCPPVTFQIPEKLTVEVSQPQTLEVKVPQPLKVEILPPKEEKKEEEHPPVPKKELKAAVAVVTGNYINGVEARLLPSPVGGAVALQPAEDSGFLLGGRVLLGTPYFYVFAGLGYASFPYGSGLTNYVAGAGVSGMVEVGLTLFFSGEIGWVWAICAQGPLLQCGLGLAF
jgi:hypothetical protein